MKVTDSQPPANNTDASVDRDDSQGSKDEPSAFSQLLAKKRGTHEDDGGSRHGKGDKLTQGGAFVQPQAMLEQPNQATPIEGKHVVALPADLQQLVKEIAVVTNKAGNQEVHIELNSTAMKGLHIRIEKQESGVAIQFQSSSDDVTKLLNANVDSLSQSLGEHGVNVADIRVSSARESVGAASNRSRSNFSQSQGTRRGGR